MVVYVEHIKSTGHFRFVNQELIKVHQTPQTSNMKENE